jgi:two-component system response regulator ChvI
MDPELHSCTRKNEEVALTVTEFLILQAPGSSARGVKSRNAVMPPMTKTIYVDDRTIDSHIKRLRRKLKAHDVEFDIVETLYGIGSRYKEV